jgi:protein-tyrosine-phosphatase
MAAALLAHHGHDRVVVRSAGSAPADQISPVVEEALHKIGVPLTDAYPKPLTNEVVQAPDVVITMGCGDACPIYAGKSVPGMGARGFGRTAPRAGPRHPR